MAQISFHDSVCNTNADILQVGSIAPQFTLVDANLADKSLDDFKGKTKILHIFPSIDTPTCALSTKVFNTEVNNLTNTVVLAISADLPFALKRFCGAEGLDNVLPLSCFRSTFAEDYGVKLIDSPLHGLTARAIILLDAENVVRYIELVSDIGNEPNYTAVKEAIAQL